MLCLQALAREVDDQSIEDRLALWGQADRSRQGPRSASLSDDLSAAIPALSPSQISITCLSVSETYSLTEIWRNLMKSP